MVYFGPPLPLPPPDMGLSMLDWLLELPVDILFPLEAVGECSGELESGGELTETMYGDSGLLLLLLLPAGPPPLW